MKQRRNKEEMASTSSLLNKNNKEKEEESVKKMKKGLGWVEWLRGWMSVIFEMLFQRIQASHLENPMPLPPIDNLTVIVTGSTSGIGCQIARQLAESGAHVVMAVRNTKAAHELIQTWQTECSGKALLLNIEIGEERQAVFNGDTKSHSSALPSFLGKTPKVGYLDGLTRYIHINQNEFSYRKHKKQKEEDVVICECKIDSSDPDSACGDGCLNVLTSTECTPGHCPCGEDCKNQKFQRCEYAKTKLFKTEGRGWGLRAEEDITAGQFIIEYCGEVISWKEAKRRAQVYETQGLMDAYIISLNSNESIDATRKGSLARFINHSCQPNCETRKWTVLGEIRVGIFAKHDIPVGTELAYDYNFEWYGGAKVRCLCGAPSCSGFLGAKSRGFQEDTYLWEDDDDRYSVEKVPLYDSTEDEPSSQPFTSSISNLELGSDNYPMEIDPLASIPANGLPPGTNWNFSLPKKKQKRLPKGKLKDLNQKELDARYVASLLETKEAKDEILIYEEIRIDATSNLESLYNEIRPAIEEHERDTQDSVPTDVAEKWIDASCSKLKSEFNLHFSIVKNIMCTPKKSRDMKQPGAGLDTEILLLTYE